MTKEEAIYRLTWAKDLSEMIGMVPIGAETRKAIDAAISALRELDKRKALRQPQPDPETGLVPCECGGKAEYIESIDEESWTNIVNVACSKCKIHITYSALNELRGMDALKEDAKAAWNKAMSRGNANG